VLNRRIVVGRNPLAVTAGTALFGLSLFIPAAGVEIATRARRPSGGPRSRPPSTLRWARRSRPTCSTASPCPRLPAGRVAVWGKPGAGGPASSPPPSHSVSRSPGSTSPAACWSSPGSGWATGALARRHRGDSPRSPRAAPRPAHPPHGTGDIVAFILSVGADDTRRQVGTLCPREVSFTYEEMVGWERVLGGPRRSVPRSRCCWRCRSSWWPSRSPGPI
jgi:hypothetical protein